jgi:hypothetical protein
MRPNKFIKISAKVYSARVLITLSKELTHGHR